MDCKQIGKNRWQSALFRTCFSQKQRTDGDRGRSCQAWRQMPGISTFGRPRQEEHRSGQLGFLVGPCFKNQPERDRCGRVCFCTTAAALVDFATCPPDPCLQRLNPQRSRFSSDLQSHSPQSVLLPCRVSLFQSILDYAHHGALKADVVHRYNTLC